MKGKAIILIGVLLWVFAIIYGRHQHSKKETVTSLQRSLIDKQHELIDMQKATINRQQREIDSLKIKYYYKHEQ